MIEKFIPPFLRDSAWLAGSYAIDPDSACDVDIWLCDIRLAHMGLIVEPMLIKWWDEQAFNVELLTKTYQDPVYPESDQYAIVTPNDGELSAHIMITHASITDIVNDFDLSIVRKAISGKGDIVIGEGYTSTFDPIVILHERPTTEYRLRKYMKRFDIKQGV